MTQARETRGTREGVADAGAHPCSGPAKGQRRARQSHCGIFRVDRSTAVGVPRCREGGSGRLMHRILLSLIRIGEQRSPGWAVLSALASLALYAGCGEGQPEGPRTNPGVREVSACSTAERSTCADYDQIQRNRCDRESDRCLENVTTFLSLAGCAQSFDDCRARAAEASGECLRACGDTREAAWHDCVGSCWYETGRCDHSALFHAEICSIGCPAGDCFEGCRSEARRGLEICTTNHNEQCLPDCDLLRQ